MGCQAPLDLDEEHICKYCLDHLPTTKYWEHTNNPIEQIFWGKLQVVSAASYLYFSKGGIVQEMLHNLKYKHQLGVGRLLGRHFGTELAKTSFSDIDLIVPVPLHKDKLRKRGYNQCDPIVEGLAEAMDKEYFLHAIERTASNESQTRKGRYERWLNVKSLFKAAQAERIAGKHVLLVDDVVTTGATLEACAAALLEVPEVRVSVASIACPAVV
ncbi:MAG: ComF family protein [Flavobacteriales bacterium]|nr:ComF family protein [Flavobacteriales bacterium]